jgi:hypothetical protein
MYKNSNLKLSGISGAVATSGHTQVLAGTGITVTKAGVNSTVATSGLDSFLAAPTWKSLANFDGVNTLALNVADLGGAWQVSQATRIKFGTAYHITLRGLVSKAGNFAPGNTVFTLPAGWRPLKNLAFNTVNHTDPAHDDHIRLDVESSGIVKIQTTALYASLDGISFWTN